MRPLPRGDVRVFREIPKPKLEPDGLWQGPRMLKRRSGGEGPPFADLVFLPGLHGKFPQAFLRRRVSWLELTNNLIFPSCVVVVSGPGVLFCPMQELWNLFAGEPFILGNGRFGFVRCLSRVRRNPRVSRLRSRLFRRCYLLLVECNARGCWLVEMRNWLRLDGLGMGRLLSDFA